MCPGLQQRKHPAWRDGYPIRARPSCSSSHLLSARFPLLPPTSHRGRGQPVPLFLRSHRKGESSKCLRQGWTATTTWALYHPTTPDCRWARLNQSSHGKQKANREKSEEHLSFSGKALQGKAGKLPGCFLANFHFPRFSDDSSQVCWLPRDYQQYKMYGLAFVGGSKLAENWHAVGVQGSGVLTAHFQVPHTTPLSQVHLCS